MVSPAVSCISVAITLACLIRVSSTAAILKSRYGRYLSGTLEQMYERAERDPNFHSLASEMALMRTLISQLLRSMNRGEGNSWKKLIKVQQDLEQAIKTADPAMLRNAVADLAKTIELGAADRDYHNQIQKAILTLTKAARGEWKRLHDLGQMLPRPIVEKLFLIENRLLVEMFGREKAREFRRRTYQALLPILGRSGSRS